MKDEDERMSFDGCVVKFNRFIIRNINGLKSDAESRVFLISCLCHKITPVYSGSFSLKRVFLEETYWWCVLYEEVPCVQIHNDMLYIDVYFGIFD